MNNLRSVILTIVVILSAFTIVTYTACKKDPCEGVNCVNGGTCNNGTCACPDGYKGTFCETKIDPCDGVVCQNGGTCVAGKCSCPIGYEGEYCEVLSREKFLGSWAGTENCTQGTISFVSTIATSPDNVWVIVTNPGGYGNNISITGVMSAGNEITFTNQSVGNGIVLNGKMTLSGNTLTFAYTVVDANSTDSCSGTYTKQ